MRLFEDNYPQTLREYELMETIKDKDKQIEKLVKSLDIMVSRDILQPQLMTAMRLMVNKQINLEN